MRLTTFADGKTSREPAILGGAKIPEPFWLLKEARTAIIVTIAVEKNTVSIVMMVVSERCRYNYIVMKLPLSERLRGSSRTGSRNYCFDLISDLALNEYETKLPVNGF